MVEIIEGDCVEVMRRLEPDSLHCCITSPPYYGLRDYGVVGQIGQETTPSEYVAALVRAFREVRRVLRPDGTLWLNLGDSFASSWPCQRQSVIGAGSLRNGKREARPPRLGDGLKDKDLIMIPHRVAIALQEDGWWVRSDIVWAKPNPMPESVTDRPTKSHEYLFLLAKSERYYYDHEAIKEPMQAQKGNAKSFRGGGAYTRSQSADNSAVVARETHGNAQNPTGRRNKRTVWTISTKGYAGAHFATFPSDLVRPCLLAGCPEGGTVLDPFAGSGTVGAVALALGRSATLIELNPAYCNLARRRLEGVQPLLV